MKKILYFFLVVSFIFTGCKKEEGCTDASATNYNADAEDDDGSCTYDIIGVWNATTVVVDTSLTVTINGVVDETQSGSGTMTATPDDAETPTNIEFLSNGTAYATFSYDNEIDTTTYTKSGSAITITDDEGDAMDFTYTISKNNLTLTEEELFQFEDSGILYNYSFSITMNFNRE